MRIPITLRPFAHTCAALGLAAACACGAIDRDAPVDTGPAGQDIALPADSTVVAARVAPGATLSTLLRGYGVADAESAELVSRAGAVFDVRTLHVNQPFRLVRDLAGAVRRFEYEIDGDRVLKVARGEDGASFAAVVEAIEKETAASVVQGAIDRDTPSLFGAMEKAGERVELSLALAAILGSEVDFNTELQVGDRFSMLVEKRYRRPDRAGDGEDDPVFAGYGPVLGVVFENDGRRIRAVRFTPSGGVPEYFDDQGRSLKRFFLKSPLKFDPVVTSRFSMSRLHPVLGESRAHLGVDYRAPTGAPVVAVADGLVLLAGMNGGAGRMVHLRHANGYETEYLHLSATALRRGARVRQGDVIGRVGATGLATGPHLDYRVRKNGVFVNPVAVHQALPPGDPVAAADMPAFVAARDAVVAELGRAVSAPSPARAE